MPKPECNDEKELLRQLHEGDYAAFETLYERYSPRLSANLMKLLKSPELTRETLQELFIKVWDNRTRIDPELSIKGYLYRIAGNLVYDLFRRAALDTKMKAHLRAFTSEIYEQIEQGIYRQEDRELLHKAISLLPPQRRKVFTLCKLEEKSYREVSELLGISQAAVNDHIRKANLFLKEYFSSHPAMAAILAMSLLCAIQ